MGKTIEELLKERAKIDAEIKKLREISFTKGNTKFVYRHFRHWDEKQVKIQQMGNGCHNWYTVLNYQTTEEVIENLEKLISDLENLHEALQEDQKRNV